MTEGPTIYAMLPTGRENAITKKTLARMVGVSERKLRLRIAEERKNGALIISSTESGGYYRPKTRQEAERFIRSMLHRGKETVVAAQAAQQALDAIDSENAWAEFEQVTKQAEMPEVNKKAPSASAIRGLRTGFEGE